MTPTRALLLALALVGCGSENDGAMPAGGSGGSGPGTATGGSGGSGGSGPATAPSAAFVGTYAARFDAFSTFSYPPGTPPAGYSDTGIITVTASGPDSIVLAWQVGNNPPSGTIEFNLDGGSSHGSATGGTPWMGRLDNGAQQTSWCDVCGVSMMGNMLTQTQEGHFQGVTATGVPYAGTYNGTWTGTRAK